MLQFIRDITKIFKVTSGRLLGRVTAGTGRGEELTPEQVRTLLEVATTTANDLAYQPINLHLTQIAGLSPAGDDFIQYKTGVWTNRTIAQVKADIGLSGINTGDQTITLTGAVTGSGTGSFVTTIAAGAVTDNMLAGSITLSKLAITEIPNGTKFLRDDGSWQTVSIDLSGYLTSSNAASTYVALAGSYTDPTWLVNIPSTKVTGLGTLATQNGTFSGTSSGTNTGDQTITLTGDVTGSGTGSFTVTIATSSVTLAKQADVATASVFYRKTAGSGPPEVQSLATLKTDLGLTGTNSGDVDLPTYDGRIRLSNGTFLVPSLVFVGGTDSGLYYSTSGSQVCIAVGGSDSAAWDALGNYYMGGTNPLITMGQSGPKVRVSGSYFYLTENDGTTPARLDVGQLNASSNVTGLNISAMASQLHPGIDDERYWTGQAGQAVTTKALVANQLYYHPFIISKTVTVTRIGLNVTTGSAGLIRLGIYGDVDGRPSGSPLLDAGTVDCTSTGEKEISISQELTPGLYWFAAVTNATPTVTCESLGGGIQYPNLGCLTGVGVAVTNATQSHTFGALPAVGTISWGTSKFPVRMWLRDYTLAAPASVVASSVNGSYPSGIAAGDLIFVWREWADPTYGDPNLISGFSSLAVGYTGAWTRGRLQVKIATGSESGVIVNPGAWYDNFVVGCVVVRGGSSAKVSAAINTNTLNVGYANSKLFVMAWSNGDANWGEFINPPTGYTRYANSTKGEPGAAVLAYDNPVNVENFTHSVYVSGYRWAQIIFSVGPA